MSGPFKDFAELRDLLDALCEESITQQQLQRLEELVLGHPEAEAFYVQYMSMFAGLDRHFAGLPAPTEQVLRQRLRSRPAETQSAQMAPAQATDQQRLSRSVGKLHRGWRFLGLAAVAAALAVAFVAPWRPWHQPPLAVLPKEEEPTDDSVAVLAQTLRAEWEDTGMPVRVGSPLRVGRLRLKTGIAQIEFYSGATVILEGPADLRLVSAKEAYCQHGKLRVMVSPQAQGFTIGSPTLNLIDRGTEFGMEVDGTSKGEVHVFRGKVDLYGAGADPAVLAPKELTTGRGVRFEEARGLTPIEANPGRFVSAQDLAIRSVEEMRRRQQRWLEASDALRQDPSLLVYYAFQTQKPWDRTLPNQAKSVRQPQDAAIVGCQWSDGRWSGKRGLEFKRVGDRVRFRVPGEYDSLTLAAWVRVDALPNRWSSLMMADGWEEGTVHWHIRNDGQIGLGVRPARDIRYVNLDYAAPNIFTPQRLGQWVQLAVVFDRDAGLVTHYLDGQSISQAPVRFDIPLRIGDVELGNWNTANYEGKANLIRNFNGCIDEFMLFARALSNEEMQQLYAQGRPQL